jgi:hypothetical protein
MRSSYRELMQVLVESAKTSNPTAYAVLQLCVTETIAVRCVGMTDRVFGENLPRLRTTVQRLLTVASFTLHGMLLAGLFTRVVIAEDQKVIPLLEKTVKLFAIVPIFVNESAISFKKYSGFVLERDQGPSLPAHVKPIAQTRFLLPQRRVPCGWKCTTWRQIEHPRNRSILHADTF